MVNMTSSRSVKVLLLTLGNGINILMNFIMMPYLARTLDYVEYGTYGQVLMITSFLQIIFTFSLNQMVNLLFADAAHSKRSSFATLFYMATFAAFAGGIFLLVSSGIIADWFKNPGLCTLLMYSVFFMAGQIIYSVLFSMLIFHERIKQASLLLVISNLIRVMMIFSSIHFYHSLEKVIWSINFVSFIQIVMALFFLPRDLVFFRKFDRVIANQIIRTAYPLTLSGITERSVFYVDGILISTMLTTSDYAIYRAGAFEVPFISAIYGSVSSILLPEVARLYKNGDFNNIVKLKQKGIMANACIIYPVLIYLLFFGKTLVTFYLSEKYVASVPVFALFNLALLVRVNDYQDILVVSANTKKIMYYSLVMFLANLGLNLILINYFGILGGAIAFISFLFMYAGLLAYKSALTVNSTVNSFFNFKKLSVIIALSILLIQPFYWLHLLMHLNIIFVVGSGLVFLLSIYGLLWKMKFLDNHLLSQLALKLRRTNKKDNAGA